MICKLTARARSWAKAFTLVELMVVVVIIGILATIAVPSYHRMRVKANIAKAESELVAIHDIMQLFHAEWRAYAGDLGAAGYKPSGDYNFDIGFRNGRFCSSQAGMYNEETDFVSPTRHRDMGGNVLLGDQQGIGCGPYAQRKYDGPASPYRIALVRVGGLNMGDEDPDGHFCREDMADGFACRYVGGGHVKPSALGAVISPDHFVSVALGVPSGHALRTMAAALKRNCYNFPTFDNMMEGTGWGWVGYVDQNKNLKTYKIKAMEQIPPIGSGC